MPHISDAKSTSHGKKVRPHDPYAGFSGRGNLINIISIPLFIYMYNRMETQTWLIHHYEFISAENISILSVSSDDFLHAVLAGAEQQIWN